MVDYTFNYMVCPVADVQTALMFAFIGLFVFILLMISIKLIKIPFFSIMSGLGLILFGVVAMGCHHLIGVIICVLGIGAIIYELVEISG